MDKKKKNQLSKLPKTTNKKESKKLVPLNDHAFKRMFGEKDVNHN